MSTTSGSTPANTLDTKDTGDDMQRRIWYQAAYVAIVSLDLLDENSEFEEVFCEHHEDTLIKKKNGTFIGVQVKTRTSGREPFKSEDAQIFNSIKRFVEHEIDYPHHFSRFVLATNYTFWSEKKSDTKNLNYILELAKDVCQTKPAKLPPKLSGYVSKLTKQLNSGRNISDIHDIIIGVLGKVKIQEDLPKFDDVESRLAMRNIPDFYDVGEAGPPDLLKAAKALIHKMFEASSLQHVSARKMYFALHVNPLQARVDEIIKGKRITKETVKSILRESLSVDTLLSTRNQILLSDLPRGMRKLELKMAKGGISALNIRLAKDLKFSYEKLFDTWIYKYPQKAKDRYDHLSVIVRNECQQAYDEAYKQDELFGKNMLIDVRHRLRERLNNESHLFFNCTYDSMFKFLG